MSPLYVHVHTTDSSITSTTISVDEDVSGRSGGRRLASGIVITSEVTSTSEVTLITSGVEQITVVSITSTGTSCGVSSCGVSGKGENMEG